MHFFFRLFDAVEGGDVEGVRNAIREGANVNRKKYEYEASPLQ